MLKKINRGLSRKDFNVSREKGVMYQTPLFGVSVINQKSESLKDESQFGFVISKKISKSAVERNKIKRRIAEAIQNQSSIFKLQSTNYNLQTFPQEDSLRRANYKIIFLVKTSILNASVDEIEIQVKHVFEKISAKDSISL